jgi:hypothetical protein
MSANTADYAGIQVIKTRDKLPLLFERDSYFYEKIGKRPADKVGSQAMRIPLKVQPGGNAGFYSSDGGDMGRGSGTLTGYATVTPVDFKTGIEITLQADWTTDAKEKAIESAVKMNLADAMPQFRSDLDCQFQTAGNAVLATVDSVSSPTITLTDTPFGARLLREQLTVSVYDSTLATRRGSMTITQVNKELGGTQSIVVDAVPGGTTGTDVIVTGGLTGASPTGFFGIPYFWNTSTNGTVLGLSRGLNYMQANGVDVNGAGITVPAAQLATDQIRQALGDKMVSGGLFWHTHPAQQAAIQNLKLQISQIIKSGGKDTDVDLGFKLDSSFNGIPVMSNIHADPTRMDAINVEALGRAEYKALDFMEIDGKRVFPIYGASGGIAAAFIYYLVCSFQLYADNLRSLTSLTDLATPVGYV